MKVRRDARRLALDVLYEAEIRDMTPIEAFEERSKLGWSVDGPDDAHSVDQVPDPEALAYARRLLAGVQEHRAELDDLIGRYADRWALDRMPVIDRSLLRMAIFELKWADDVPVPVAINEAVELAKAMSTDDSGRFVNGLLGRIVDEDQAAKP